MKVISCNIERSKHIDKIIPFVVNNKPDVFCIQELYTPDRALFLNMLSWDTSVIADTCIPDGFDLPNGIAALSKNSVISQQVHMLGDYVDETHIPLEIPRDPHSVNWKVIQLQYPKFDLFVVHAPVSKQGDIITDYQKQYLERLLKILEQSERFVLCGDLNSARGSLIWNTLGNTYTDNIPGHYTTSIDNSLHYAGHKNLQYVVDCCFSHNVQVSKVHYHPGLSDHYALSFEIND